MVHISVSLEWQMRWISTVNQEPLMVELIRGGPKQANSALLLKQNCGYFPSNCTNLQMPVFINKHLSRRGYPSQWCFKVKLQPYLPTPSPTQLVYRLVYSFLTSVCLGINCYPYLKKRVQYDSTKSRVQRVRESKVQSAEIVSEESVCTMR